MVPKLQAFSIAHLSLRDCFRKLRTQNLVSVFAPIRGGLLFFKLDFYRPKAYALRFGFLLDSFGTVFGDFWFLALSITIVRIFRVPLLHLKNMIFRRLPWEKKKAGANQATPGSRFAHQSRYHLSLLSGGRARTQVLAACCGLASTFYKIRLQLFLGFGP